MIFARTFQRVLAREKSQTRRLKYARDTLGYVIEPDGRRCPAVFDNTDAGRPRTRWVVGRTYAVQPERCHRAVCRIRITSLREEADPTQISEADAKAEGFENAAAFVAAWMDLHKKHPIQAVWVIGFEVIGKPKGK